MLRLLFAGGLLFVLWDGRASRPETIALHTALSAWVSEPETRILPVDSPDVPLPFPVQDPVNPYDNGGRINLTDPSNVNNVIEYDPVTGEYYFYSRIGDKIDYKNPTVMTFEEYMEYNLQNSVRENWTDIRQNASIGSDDDDDGTTPFAPSIEIKSKAFDRIFGGSTVDIRPQGSAELIFGVNINSNENPLIPVRQRRITTFNFDQRIQMNVVGNIGEKLRISTNYNTEATFDFENQTKIEYTGTEDEIIQKIEAGNVTLPLNNSLITGSQSLFGLKTELKFGKLRATTIFSQEKSERKEITVQGGAQRQEYEISIDNYEANRHYFLSDYFRDNYDRALASLPVVNSQVNITRIEVWVVNQRAAVEDVRNIIALTDLGEDLAYVNPDLPLELQDNPLNTFPDNQQNNLYALLNGNPDVRNFNASSQALNQLGLVSGRDYERLSNARKLDPSEYTFNARLGFISLNQALNNAEVLAVSYEYTLNGQTFRVGDLSNDGFQPPQAIYAKLLKSTIVDVNNPLWDLMMKNIYSLGAFQVSPEEFVLNIWYNDPREGIDIPIIPQPGLENVPLVQFFGLDQLDQNNSANPDGRFDFVDGAHINGGTINAQNGRIYFTKVEPFGEYLEQRLIEFNVPPEERERIVYQPLYDSTKVVAQQNFLPLNRFKLKGQYQSASSDEIYLNALNIPQGAVRVTAGGVTLVENRDYTVDYNLGRVKILNTGLLESQTPINISIESNTLFTVQNKTLLGGRFDYAFNDNLNLGATILNLYERPITQKVNIGDEPMRNTLWGFDAQFQDESRLITELIDALPGIETKETSSIDFMTEFAHLIPGHSRAVGQNGNAYIDDFEGAVSVIDLRNFQAWGLSSVPQAQQSIWPEAQLLDDRRSNYNRASIAWYILDPLFFRNDNITPDNINPDRHYQREVLESEVFPNRVLPAGTPNNIGTFDLAYFPSERGQYNYDAEPTSISAGVDPATGALNNPATRWGGVQRAINTTDFEQTNVEYIQFWIMDPYNVDSRDFLGVQGNPQGKLYVHLGNVSEDVLRDGQMSFENGLPPDPGNPGGFTTAETNLARVPTTQSLVNAFDNTSNSNANQDVGLDGWNDDGERSFFGDFIDRLTAIGAAPGVVQQAQADPSSDNYAYYRGSEQDAQQLDIFERYKRYNGQDGNSITSADSPESFPIQGTTLPSTEDINQDLTLGEAEQYYQYEINMPDPNVNPSQWQIGNNYITDIQEGSIDGRVVRWYQFKIPIREGQSINGIQDLRSIRFMRLATRGFQTPVILRFARLELVRGEWRRYTESLRANGEAIVGEDNTIFEINAVNIEENSNRQPFPYLTPPGIVREIDAGTANQRALNEQSLAFRVTNLADGDARAAFRSFNIDARMYGKMQMFVHAESLNLNDPLEFAEATVIVRLGTDFEQNYYEYEMPLTPSVLGNETAGNIWPEANNLEIDFNFLQKAKNDRNQSGFEVSQPYVVFDGDRKVTVVGNPVLSSVRTILVGVRNPTAVNGSNDWVPDNGQDINVEVWVNELRLTDFNQEGGWAAVARMNAQLADLGTLSLAGSISTPNFGGLESKVADRQQETIVSFDASTNLELGKFLPENTGIRLPMFASYSQIVSTPRFDPLSPDLELQEVTRGLTREEVQRIRQRSQSVQRSRSLNFTNVRKDRVNTEKTPHLWDIENFAFTFAWSEISRYDINTSFDNRHQYRLGLAYNYGFKPKNIKPFETSRLLTGSTWLRLIGDFNFNLIPKSIAFRTDVNRTYNELQYRNNTDFNFFEQPILVTKTFNWSRQYDVQYDLTENLRLTYNANNLAVIGEPFGRVNRDQEPDLYQQYRDSVWSSIRNFGETTSFTQNVTGNYKLPIDKLPLLDWTSTDVTYTGSYLWNRAPFSQDTLGNTIQNSQNISVNSQLNFLTLYNKLPYFRKVNQKFRSLGRPQAGARGPAAQSRGNADANTKEDDRGSKIGPLDYAARIFMSLKTFTFRYTENNGTLLPGYNRETQIAGLDPNFSAPGLPFVFGWQYDGYNYIAARNGWLIENPYLNTMYQVTNSEDVSMRLNLEPLPSFRIELTTSLTETMNDGSFFRFNNDLQDYLEDSRFQTGSFTTTFIGLGSFFDQTLDNNASANFQRFLDLRRDVSNRFADETGLSEEGSGVAGYADGFGPGAQQNILPAFLAAYGDKDVDEVPLRIGDYKFVELFKNPNWSIAYDGLTKFNFFKKYFRTFTVSHAYRSVFSVNNYTTNLSAGIDANGMPLRDNTDEANFIDDIQIQAITLTEQFSPLFNIDATWLNSLITKFEISRGRTLSFSTANYQLTENRTDEMVLGLGYRIPGVKVKVGGKTRNSDLNLRCDLSIRDTEIITRRVAEIEPGAFPDPGESVPTINQIASGQNIISIKTAADYVLSERLNIRAFYDHQINQPKVSTTFRTTNISAGISLRFTLAQ